MHCITLDIRDWTDRAAAHRAIAQAMAFPAWYGGNLDALADCLSELGPQTHVVLLHAAEGTDCAARILEVFRALSAQPDAFSLTVCE